MRIAWIVRLIGLIIFAAVGWNIGQLVQQEATLSSIPRLELIPYALALVGGLFGLIVAPWLSIHPMRRIQREIRRIPIQNLIAATLGLGVGLLISMPVAYASSFLPFSLGRILPILAALLLGYLGMMAALWRQRELFALLGGRWAEGNVGTRSDYILLDSSVIIDGRIEYVSQTGFIEGTLLVPRFVLNEVQHIADSSDPLRRNRGRRGLEVLNKLQKNPKVRVEITDLDVDEVQEVDSKLVWLARQLNCPILTNDYNLNRVAGIQGVKVLNINELANAVKTLILPGETIKVRIIQEGKEVGQGVGYLDDGTMIVVENGRRYMNTTTEVTITRVLQTDKGRMMFATPSDGTGGQR